MIPEQVKRLGEEADRMIAELARQNAAPAAEPAPAETPAPTPEPEVPAAENTDQGVVAAQTESSDPSSELEAQVAELQRRLDEAEQRYRSEHGRLEKRTAEVEQLRTLLATVAQPAPEPAPAAKPQSPLLTAKDEDAFGADLVDMARRAARQELQGELAKRDSLIDELKAQLSGVTSTASSIAQESFEGKLTRLAPSWEKHNVDPAFLAWLDDVMPMTGMSRRVLFNEAAKRRDAGVVAEFFNAYAPAQPVAAPAPATPNPQLEKLVAPSKGRAAPAPVTQPQVKKTWTTGQIAKFYEDARRGKFSSDERNRLESDIFEAQRDGRIAA